MLSSRDPIKPNTTVNGPPSSIEFADPAKAEERAAELVAVLCAKEAAAPVVVAREVCTWPDVRVVDAGAFAADVEAPA